MLQLLIFADIYFHSKVFRAKSIRNSGRNIPKKNLASVAWLKLSYGYKLVNYVLNQKRCLPRILKFTFVVLPL